jgi:hypothetical protein
MTSVSVRPAAKIAFAIAVFAVLAAAILSRPGKWLTDFDQSFYLTIAYDLDRHGVFSNGVFDNTDSSQAAPPPGMFFVPGYPLVVLAAMKLDPRFAEAVACIVERREGCESYALPVLLLHALFLALGVLAIARSAELLFDSRRVFWLAGALATVSLLPSRDLFSFAMTESLTFFLYSLAALALVFAWKTARTRNFVLAGCALGLLCLTRPSFLVLLPVVAGLSVLHSYRFAAPEKKRPWTHAAVLVLGFLVVVGPWLARNAVSVGKFGLSEEYGAATLIERFAFDDITWREYLLAFPYCLPAIGPPLVASLFGADAMDRFQYDKPGSFFAAGRARRIALVKEHGRLDPIIGNVFRDELRNNGWRYVLVSLPLAWCGLWTAGIWSLVLLPLFGWACLRALRQSQPLFLLYAIPPLVMVGLHAAVANHYTRYNLILIGPFAAGAAWIICGWIARARSPSRVPAPGP